MMKSRMLFSEPVKCVRNIYNNQFNMLYIKFFETSSRVLLIEFLGKKDYSIAFFIVFLILQNPIPTNAIL